MNDANLMMANGPDEGVPCPMCNGTGKIKEERPRWKEDKKCVRCGKVVGGKNSGHTLPVTAKIPKLMLPDGNPPTIELDDVKMCHTCWLQENYRVAELWGRYEEELIANAELAEEAVQETESPDQ